MSTRADKHPDSPIEAFFPPRPFSGHYDLQVEQTWAEHMPDVPARGMPTMSVLAIAAGLFQELHNQVFKPFGHNYNEYTVLSLLLFNDRAIRPSEFTRQHGKASVATAQALKRLEQGGLVVRRPNPEDRRSNLVYLTEAGEARANLLCRLDAERSSAALSALSDDELVEARTVLNKLIRAMVKEV